jgi:hypothetical protein
MSSPALKARVDAVVAEMNDPATDTPTFLRLLLLKVSLQEQEKDKASRR